MINSRPLIVLELMEYWENNVSISVDVETKTPVGFLLDR